MFLSPGFPDKKGYMVDKKKIVVFKPRVFQTRRVIWLIKTSLERQGYMVDKKYPKGSIIDIIIKYKIHLETGLFKGILKIFLYTTSIPT